jgi:hypothetical protein
MALDDQKRAKIVHQEDMSVLKISSCTKDDVTQLFVDSVRRDELMSEEGKEQYDPTLGVTLTAIKEAKLKEEESLKKHGVYIPVHKSKAVGGRIIGTRWVLRAKGAGAKARLVVQDVNHDSHQDPHLFSPTPSLMSLKLLLCHASIRSKGSKTWVLQAGDVETAFLNAGIEETIYIRPPRDHSDFQRDFLWQLRKSLYGLRTAPKAWHGHVKSLLEEHGYKCSRIDGGVFYNHKTDSMLVIHVDDIIVSGDAKDVDHLFQSLSSSLILKLSAQLRSSSKDDEVIEFLGRTISRQGPVFLYHGDASLVDLSLSELNMVECKSAPTPGVVKGEDESEVLDDETSAAYRRHTGRLMYLAQDRLDAQFSVKQLARSMSAPTQADFTAVKRALRYLAGRRVLTYRFDVSMADYAQPCVYVDSDWAGCRVTRRSTSGGILCLGAACVGSWSKTQSTVALSSAEAELGAICTGTVEAQYLKSLLVEQGIRVDRVVVHSDSHAALDGLVRGGVGRLKHIGTKSLFLQELVKNKTVSLRKIKGDVNVADILTKHVPEKVLTTLLALLPVSFDDKKTEDQNLSSDV